ncbi:chromosome partitioning protein ParA [Marinithermofilum abyssi]|uniref:Chromosome partitioning protein ParA n=1 Tax=Marinithermofilum abyssi TaxID=1571185 RepID=A0A8J2YF86_9BACL|nr:ParA family protein [Marinithermofilum abyssi]GGE28817.1 chromosome partitioning protein ParA [Marinithermofilum abyssi]
MNFTISWGIQKGGSGKTTSCAIVSHLLAEKGYRVLAIDFDSQGNLTQFLTQMSLFEFEDKNVLQAMEEKNADKYIHIINDRLHLLPADDYLATFSKFVYVDYDGNPQTLLQETLEPIKSRYDFLMIDLPPNLGIETINGLCASDGTIALLQPEPFCYDALQRYEETVDLLKSQVNPNLRFLGILTTMMDSRTVLDEAIYHRAKARYEDLLFSTVIKRRVRLKEFTLSGIKNESLKDQAALRPYIDLVEELIYRVKKESLGCPLEK